VTIRLNASELKDYEERSKQLGFSVGKMIKWASNEYLFPNERTAELRQAQIEFEILNKHLTSLEDSLIKVCDVMNERFGDTDLAREIAAKRAYERPFGGPWHPSGFGWEVTEDFARRFNSLEEISSKFDVTERESPS